MDNSKDKTAQKSSKRQKPTGFEEWGGYMEAKKRKLEDQFQKKMPIELAVENTVNSTIFKGISIFVNGYTKPTAEELKRLMMLHGGTYHFYYSSSKTTHTIATNLPYSKIKNLKNQIVVRPDWITESIKAGKLLSHQDFLLYSPETKDNQLRITTGHCFASKSSEGVNVCDNLEKNKNILVNDNNNSSSCEVLINSPIAENICLNTNSPKKSNAAVNSADPNFLSEFYGHSRLHHISTAGQELKAYVQQLAEKQKGQIFPGRERLRNLKSPPDIINCSLGAEQNEQQSKCSLSVVMHLDMDCFFVSVGLKSHPELRGFPVAVTHSKGKGGGAQKDSDIHYEANHYASLGKKKISGMIDTEKELEEEIPFVARSPKDYGSLSEIASCNYEARAAGLRNGMFLGEALKRCPNLKTIPYDFEGYSKVSRQLYDTVASYTLDIEAVSCDELYVDCTEVLKSTGVSPRKFSKILRAEIKEKTGCPASAGLGSNMLLARLATRVAKPNGQFYLGEVEVDEFMKKQNVSDLPGVGYTTAQKLECLGAVTCSDLQRLPLSKLQQEFGPKTGQSLFDHCRGKDDKVVELHKDRKSVSAEINYGIRFEEEEDIYKFIKELSVEVQKRLESIRKKGRSITLKLKIRKKDAPLETAKFMGHGVCDNYSKSVILRRATNDCDTIASECCALSRTLNINCKDYRGVGIQLSKLENVQNEIDRIGTIKNFLLKEKQTSANDCSTQGKGATKEIKSNDSHVEKNSITHLYSKQTSPKKSNSFASSISAAKGKEATKEIKSNDTHVEKNSITNLFSRQTSPKKSNGFASSISAAELDQSVLNALPEDIRKEILDACNISNKVKSIGGNDLSSKNLSSTVDKSKKKSSTNQQALFPMTADEPTNVQEKAQSKSSKKAALGGAVELDDVHRLLKEWTESTKVPEDTDINQFKDYCLDVIGEDLKKIDIILKYFYRLANSSNESWKQAYITVLSYVQQKMLQDFGCMLQAKSDFPSK